MAYQRPENKQEALRIACGLWGIQPEYWDIFGHHHCASPEAQARVLGSMGIPATNYEELSAAIEARISSEWTTIVTPVIVASLSDGAVPIQVSARDNADIDVCFRWEDGSNSGRIHHAVSSLKQIDSAEIGGAVWHRLSLPLPANAPLGYHEVEVNGAVARLILCPDQAYKPPFLHRASKGAGIAISLYGLRSERNWGCGDFTDLERFTTWAAEELEVSFVALNPLHLIPNRQPYNTSPYLPNCSFYRNPLYLDVERIEEVFHSALAQRILSTPAFQQCLAELRNARHVEYEKVWTLKLRFLKLGFRVAYGRGLSKEFLRWADSEGVLLHKYAVYSALDELLHKRDRNLWIWPDWPEEYRDSDSPDVADFAAAHPRLVLFYKWMQWQVDRQLERAQAHAVETGMAIGLYHDLALATDRCGSDLWAHGNFYIEGCRVGSPPDDFSPKGQDWAFPPPNSERHREDGYRLFRESIRRNLKHGGALRIDHVMRFFRLFWIPDGAEASEGLYVRDYSEDLLRILALESVRNRVLVIGEDLGTVEPYIREALSRFGILSYRLLYFEKKPDGSFRLPGEYPRQALASISTHDLPTAAGFWEGRDIEARRAAGVLTSEENYSEQWQGRQVEKQRMLDTFAELKLLPDWFPTSADRLPEFGGELHNAFVGFLAQTPSELMVLSVEDLFKQTDQQNLPGTTEQYPNWRGKVRYSIEDMRRGRAARDFAGMYRSWIRRSERANQTAGD
ncbi:MAG TPA: 4-alpha-glucanotransferase [Bryobacteraceae bacterium]|nr:4-alpha-glucanotransferase [Bryobacteraceae bacterium]